MLESRSIFFSDGQGEKMYSEVQLQGQRARLLHEKFCSSSLFEVRHFETERFTFLSVLHPLRPDRALESTDDC